MVTESRIDRRRFTRVELGLPVHMRQGDRVWHQRLIDISLSGVATDKPQVWDAQHDKPFTLTIEHDDSGSLELIAYVQYVDGARLGFSVQPLPSGDFEPLRALMEAHMDIFLLEEELKNLT
jgi:PilZ domain-containing protein